MRRRIRRVVCLALAVAAGTIGGVGRAQQLEFHATTTANIFVPGDAARSGPDGSLTLLTMVEGSKLVFDNLDTDFDSHSMTSDQESSPDQPVFDSGVIGPRKSAVVTGAESLAPGIYAFHCSIVFHDMHGYLRVVALPGGAS